MRCNSYGFNAEGLFTGQEDWSEECRWVKNNLFDSANEDCTANVDRSNPLLNIRRCSMNCGNYSNMERHDFSLTDSDVYTRLSNTTHQKKCNRCSILGWHNISTNIHSVTDSESCESFWIPNPSFDKNDCTAPFVLSTPNKCYFKCSKNCGNYGKRSEHSFSANVYRKWDNISHKRGCLYCNQFGTGNNLFGVEGCTFEHNPSSNDCTANDFQKCNKNCGNTRPLNGTTTTHTFNATNTSDTVNFPIWKREILSNGTARHQKKCGNHLDCRVYGRNGQSGTNTSSNTNGWDNCTYSFTDCTVSTPCTVCNGNSKAYASVHNFGGDYHKLGDASTGFRHYRKCSNNNGTSYCNVYGLNGQPDNNEPCDNYFGHNQGQNNCTNSNFLKCSLCGNTKAEALSHTLPPYTTDCTAVFTCSVPNCTQTGRHNITHNWGSWQNNTSNHIRYCSRCGSSTTDPHDFTGTVISTTTTTHRRQCTSCTATQNQDHTYSYGGSSITASHRACPGTKVELPCNVCGITNWVNTANHDFSGTGSSLCSKCRVPNTNDLTNYGIVEYKCIANKTVQGGNTIPCNSWLGVIKFNGATPTECSCGKKYMWNGSSVVEVVGGGGL